MNCKWVIPIVISIVISSFLTWRDEHKKVEKLEKELETANRDKK